MGFCQLQTPSERASERANDEDLYKINTKRDKVIKLIAPHTHTHAQLKKAIQVKIEEIQNHFENPTVFFDCTQPKSREKKT